MDVLKKIFPLSWKLTSDTTNFVIGIIVYVLAGAIFGLVAGLANAIFGWIPLLGGILAWVLRVVGGVIGAYSIVGLILLILAYFKKI